MLLNCLFKNDRLDLSKNKFHQARVKVVVIVIVVLQAKVKVVQLRRRHRNKISPGDIKLVILLPFLKIHLTKTGVYIVASSRN